MAAVLGNSQQGDASASASSDEHPLISLHANNKNSSAAATAAVKLETKTNTTESDNKDNVVRIMSSRNNHSSPASSSSSSSWKLSSLLSIKTAILMLILPGILVYMNMISSLEATHEIIMDNKIATSAIILHHCHSFMMTFANAVSKLVLSIKDAVLYITTISLSSSTLLSSPTNRHSNHEVIAIEQLQTRLQKGQLLLSAYNDQSGSDMVCHGVANSVVQLATERKWKTDAGSSHGEFDDNIENDKSTSSSSLSSTSLPLSYSSLISLQLSQEESSLLSKSLSCVAEANLALYSSSSSSTKKKQQHLNIAKSFLDNAMIIDPTDPLIRANVGLVNLLLGTTASSSPPPSAATSGSSNGYDDDHDESPVQFVLQSIQNLNVAIGILNNNIKEYESSSSSTNEAVYMAALHNLGIAHLALDGFDDDSSDHYLEWINSLAITNEEESDVPSTTSSILESSALLMVNKDTSLLHIDNRVDDAIVGLTSFIDEFCMSGDDVVNEVTKPIKSKQKREDELCTIVRHNLAIAKGDGGASNSEDKIDISTILVDDAVEESSVELNTNVSTELGDNKTDYIIEDNTQGVQHSSTSDESNATNSADNQEEEVQQREEEEDIDVVDAPPKSKVNHEMQSALVALEKAAETMQRSRLLLALAKARVSAGDYAGAVDAALKAVSTASTNEEIDTSTSYLDSLMNQITDEESDAAQTDMKSAKDYAQARLGEEDLSVTELKLKLELEKLKYKVLEQEMRLAQQQQYQAWNHHPQRDINLESVKAIDYMQNDDHHHFYDQARPVKAIEEVVEMENDTLSEEVQDSDSAKENTTDDFSPVDAEMDTKEEDPSKNEQHEQVKAPAGHSKETEIDPDVIDFDDEDPVVGEKSELNVLDVDEDAPAVAEETSLVQQEQKVLPSLFIPVQEQPTDLTAHAKSYMKMADAYLDKGQYALASKQFLKVIKKVSDHLPAHIGYATAIERDGKSKQIIKGALAYGNATRVAITQAPPIDPLVQAGGGGIAENILRRAVKLAKAAPAQRLETLQILSTHAHTAALAADIYYEIGLEIASSSESTVESRASAKEAFTIANEFVLTRNDDKSRFHIGSTIELGRLALDGDNDAKKATEYLNQIKDDHMEDNDHVKLLILVGRAHMALGEIEVAISQLTRALSLPDSPDTQNAHYELAIALTKNKADKHEIDIHFEKALDFGMDPTDEIIEALGERNMSVMKALNRQYYRSFNNQADSGRSEGGILSGGGVGSQSSSLFASQQASQDDSTQSDPLSLLEQGASAYDAGSPMGGEVESSESNLSHLSNRKAK